MGDWEEILLELSTTDSRHGGFILSAIKEITTLRAESEDHRQQLRKEQLTVQAMRAELDEWRHGERRYAPLTQDYKEVVAEVWALKAENESLRTLLNCYNLGGWTDSLALLQENEALKKALRDTVLTYVVDDQAYDREAEADKFLKYISVKLAKGKS